VVLDVVGSNPTSRPKQILSHRAKGMFDVTMSLRPIRSPAKS
jgi:hypothetical protein